jgi:hypothetical protein
MTYPARIYLFWGKPDFCPPPWTKKPPEDDPGRRDLLSRLPRKVFQKFCPGAYLVFTPAPALAIRRFLNSQ